MQDVVMRYGVSRAIVAKGYIARYRLTGSLRSAVFTGFLAQALRLRDSTALNELEDLYG
jgi:hypothetical protein